MRQELIAGIIAAVLACALVPTTAGAADTALDLAVSQAQRLIVPSGTTILAASVSPEGKLPGRIPI